MKTFTVTVTDQAIIKSYNKHKPESPDSPTEYELAVIRFNISGLDEDQQEMISLHWLRNRIVTLRKGNKLDKK